MRNSAKLGLAALMAALLLSAAVSTASARNLEVSNQNIRVTWSRLEFREPAGIINIQCQVTLEGSFVARTIPKVERTLIGLITRAPVKKESCTNARASAEGLPWHITYEGFRGTLPRIEEVFFLLREALLGLERLAGSTAECRFGTATDNITLRAVINATGEATNLVPVEGRNNLNLLERRGETAFVRCPATWRLVGAANDGRITLLGNTNTIIIRLI